MEKYVLLSLAVLTLLRGPTLVFGLDLNSILDSNPFMDLNPIVDLIKVHQRQKHWNNCLITTIGLSIESTNILVS